MMIAVLMIAAFLVLCHPDETMSLQLLPPYALVEDLQQSNPLFGLSTDSLTAFSFSPSSSTSTTDMNLLLYITTHFSEQHLRYFHCCWPKLVQESPLISSAHILVVASNHTPVDEAELDYLSGRIFQNNPSYQIQFLDRYPNPCDKFRNEVPKGTTNNNYNPLKLPVNYKQCMANLGVRVGFLYGWVHHHNTLRFDWMIRINPDVLIRKSKWLLETMQASVDTIPTSALTTTTTTNSLLNTKVTMAIGVHCATRQVHTDFFALRPHFWNASAFSKMGRKGNKWNHERTAYREMAHLIHNNNNNNNNGTTKSIIQYLPDVDPSEGSCRVRGTNASVYHVHDSCQEDMVCLALDGWDLRRQ